MKDLGLSEWLDTYLARKYGRYLQAQFFQGRIISIGGTNFAFTASIVRSGESTADGNAYAVNPFYLPSIGDNVECTWRDGFTGYVLWPIAKSGTPTISNVHASANTVVATGNDLSGSFTWNVTVSIAGGGRLFTVTYNRAFPVVPQVHVQATAAFAALPLLVSNKTTASFDIYAGAATGTGSNYSCDFSAGP